jgi:hypothetical protein
MENTGMKRHASWIASGLLVAAIVPGCQGKRDVAPIPPLPPARVLNGPVGEQPAPAEKTETATADPARPKTPEELQQEVREAVARLKDRGLIKEIPELQTDETPPVKVAAKVPPRGDQPIDHPAPEAEAESAAGRSAVSLTTITPASGGSKTSASPQKTEPRDTTIAAPTGKITLENLAKHYEHLAKKNPGDTEIARTLRFLHFLSGNDAAALEAIVGLPTDRQQVWHWLMSSMISARDRVPGMSEAGQAAEVLEDLDRVRQVLKKQAPLELGEVRFCTKVRRFGDYDPLPANRFRPGEQTTLYAEIRNFVSDQGDDGLYRVRLNVALSLERPDGTSISQESIPNVVDTCRRPREDFFLRVTFPIPGSAASGKYILKITFEDTTARKQTGARLEIEVAR